MEQRWTSGETETWEREQRDSTQEKMKKQHAQISSQSTLLLLFSFLHLPHFSLSFLTSCILTHPPAVFVSRYLIKTLLSSGASTFHIWASSFHAPSFSPPPSTPFFCLWFSHSHLACSLFFCFQHYSTFMWCVICLVSKPFSLHSGHVYLFSVQCNVLCIMIFNYRHCHEMQI